MSSSLSAYLFSASSSSDNHAITQYNPYAMLEYDNDSTVTSPKSHRSSIESQDNNSNKNPYTEISMSDTDSSLNTSKNPLSPSNSTSSQSSEAISLDSAKKAVATSSNALTTRLQAASKKRRLFLSRRRNSMKEKGVRANNKLILTNDNDEDDGEDWMNDSIDINNESNNNGRTLSLANPPLTNRSFKALPLPLATGTFGAGGQIGVPKVNKRPATVAVSPDVFGRRRSSRLSTASTASSKVISAVNSGSSSKIKMNAKNIASVASRVTRHSVGVARSSICPPPPPKTKKKINGLDPYKPFHALPLPSTTNAMAGEGDYNADGSRKIKTRVGLTNSEVIDGESGAYVNVKKRKSIVDSNNLSSFKARSLPNSKTKGRNYSHRVRISDSSSSETDRKVPSENRNPNTNTNVNTRDAKKRKV